MDGVVHMHFGIVRAFDRDAYTADVELLGYPGTLLVGVPVAFSVREDLVVDGIRCVLLMADVLDARSAVVVALYGGRPADDPRFDPLVGHRHRGLLGDGPKL
mgnify:CR=1 FL=1